ncbi:MAG TPA: endonuclease III domain-containing protein [Phycisphaerae bacterium]|nr:endonuclease III domain-containing protein [Phycisphaerae bacterium]
MTTATTLMEMYQAMRERFGPQGWWPGNGPLEICVGAILTQNTNWSNVEKAIANLRSAGVMTVDALAGIEQDQLAELIRPAGYYKLKSRRLGNFIAAVAAFEDFSDKGQGKIHAFLDRSVNTLREELVAINGIGLETADSIILYAACKATFVIDTYTCRIASRHGLICPEDGYEAVKELFESSLEQDIDLYNDFHAQLVAVGKNFCRPKPRCAGWPLEKFPHDLDQW